MHVSINLTLGTGTENNDAGERVLTP